MPTRLSNIIIESGCQVATRAILGDIKAPSVITNIVEDIYILASAVGNLKFL